MAVSHAQRATELAKEIQDKVNSVIEEKFPGRDRETLTEEEVNPVIRPVMEKYITDRIEEFEKNKDAMGALALATVLEVLADGNGSEA